MGLSKENVSGYVFNDVNIPVIVTDKKDDIVLFNDYCPTYLGKTEASLMNVSIKKFFKKTDKNIYTVKNLEKECTFDKTEIIDKFGEKLFNIYFIRDITQERKNLKLLKESKDELERMYNRDSLTGLLNRRGFYQEYNEIVKKGDKGFITILILDLDNLKDINDNWGHNAGDFAIITLSEALEKWIGDLGICARFGGDEFVGLIYQETSDPKIGRTALKEINSRLAQSQIANKLPYDLKCSVGAFTTDCPVQMDIDVLLSKADKALYRIKEKHHKDQK